MHEIYEGFYGRFIISILCLEVPPLPSACLHSYQYDGVMFRLRVAFRAVTDDGEGEYLQLGDLEGFNRFRCGPSHVNLINSRIGFTNFLSLDFKPPRGIYPIIDEVPR